MSGIAAVRTLIGGSLLMFCATVLYPSREGATFDFEQYAEKLAPMYAEVLGDNCVRFEVRRGLAAPGRSAPHYLCIASYWVRSDKAFETSLRDPRMADVMAKFASFTDIQPLRQFDEVVTRSS